MAFRPILCQQSGASRAACLGDFPRCQSSRLSEAFIENHRFADTPANSFEAHQPPSVGQPGQAHLFPASPWPHGPIVCPRGKFTHLTFTNEILWAQNRATPFILIDSHCCFSTSAYSSSLSSSASPAAAFLAGFFFFLFLFLLLVVFLDRGCSRILRISSSSIFLSDLTLLRSRAGGAPSLVMPFLVMAAQTLAGCLGIMTALHGEAYQ